MAATREFNVPELVIVRSFFALLESDDLGRLDAAVPDSKNTPTWWLRDEITAEQNRRHDR